VPRCSAAFRIEITGVMPLPPASSSRSPSKVVGVNRPAGGSTSSTAPGSRVSQIQFEACPSATRFTVIFRCSSRPGVLDSE
jgi:hypothetical protein